MLQFCRILLVTSGVSKKGHDYSRLSQEKRRLKMQEKFVVFFSWRLTLTIKNGKRSQNEIKLDVVKILFGDSN